MRIPTYMLSNHCDSCIHVDQSPCVDISHSVTEWALRIDEWVWKAQVCTNMLLWGTWAWSHTVEKVRIPVVHLKIQSLLASRHAHENAAPSCCNNNNQHPSMCSYQHLLLNTRCLVILICRPPFYMYILTHADHHLCIHTDTCRPSSIHTYWHMQTTIYTYILTHADHLHQDSAHNALLSRILSCYLLSVFHILKTTRHA